MGGMEMVILILKLIVALLQLLDAVLEIPAVIQVQATQKRGGKPPLFNTKSSGFIAQPHVTFADTPLTQPIMTFSVFCILLFAALLHASWNAIVKAGSDKLYSAIAVSGSASLIALILLPFSPQPDLASAPYLAASCALQVVYTVLVAKTYQFQT